MLVPAFAGINSGWHPGQASCTLLMVDPCLRRDDGKKEDGMAMVKMKEATNLTPEIKKILSWYEGASTGTKENIARILMHGKLGGTGKLVLLPVDQGFEHGPARSLAKHPAA